MDLEKETLKHGGTGLVGTRRILPKEVYELEEEEEREEKPKGWLSWFQTIYWRNAEDESKPESSVESSDMNSQSRPTAQTASTKDESPSASILSKIIPTIHKNDSTSHAQKTVASPVNIASKADNPSKGNDSTS